MRKIQLPLFLSGLLVSVPSWADRYPIDGATRLLCATSESVECTEFDDCSINLPEVNSVPRFIRVGLEQGQVDALWPPGSGKQSQIGNRIDLVDRVLLQGVDNRVPWSATISKETGKFVVTQSRGETAFVVFGVCMPD
ncbi:MAG: hypothetical protein GY703_17295 [Gammaproteobacteria bacterium]|nr:hypothetical protein [Gammaproteobacteria bacterium]